MEQHAVQTPESQVQHRTNCRRHDSKRKLVGHNLRTVTGRRRRRVRDASRAARISWILLTALIPQYVLRTSRGITALYSADPPVPPVLRPRRTIQCVLAVVHSSVKLLSALSWRTVRHGGTGDGDRAEQTKYSQAAKCLNDDIVAFHSVHLHSRSGRTR